MDLSIIIVSHGHDEYIWKCISTIYQNTKKIKFETILIENFPRNASLHTISDLYKIDHYHCNEVSEGLSANNNRGLALARGEIVLFLNPDTFVVDDAIERMVKFFRENPTTGILAPMLLNFDSTYQKSARRFPRIGSSLIRRFHLSKLLCFKTHHEIFDIPPDQPKQVDWVLGACMMFNRKELLELGGFDEAFFLYCEDIDICRRYRDSGRCTTYFPHAKIYHSWQRKSDRAWLSRNNYLHFKSMAYFLVKHKNSFWTHRNSE